MNLRPVEEQVVVVTGASSGIGRETAIALASRGAKVIVSARGEDGLDSLVDAILGFGGNAFAVPADVTDPGAMAKVADKAVERFGGLDTWVHAAAVSIYARFEDTRPDEFEQIVRTNLLGAANGAMAALPHLRERGGGAFICVSSVEAVRALPYQSAYAAAKHGINGMLESLRVELRNENASISITEIQPSSVDTPLFEHARTRLGVQPKGMPPIYDARLVAKAVVHAAEKPTRRLVVGGGGRVLATLENLAPGMVDGFLARAGFRTQKTRIRKSESAADNLSGPIDRGHTVAGGHEIRGRRWSLYTAWALSPWRRPMTAAAALAGVILASRVLAGRRGESDEPAYHELAFNRRQERERLRNGRREPIGMG